MEKLIPKATEDEALEDELQFRTKTMPRSYLKNSLMSNLRGQNGAPFINETRRDDSAYHDHAERVTH